MKQSKAWLEQAKSDWIAAQAMQVVPDDKDYKKASSYCQAIAKYQQVTEKSIKGMIAALNKQGIVNIRISTTQHKVTHEMNALAASRRNGMRSADKNWVEKIDSGLKKRKEDIEWLSNLAPSGQKEDGTFVKNTEYPFNDSSPGGWTAPAALGIYSSADVTRAYNLAQKLLKQASSFISAMDRR